MFIIFLFAVHIQKFGRPYTADCLRVYYNIFLDFCPIDLKNKIIKI